MAAYVHKSKNKDSSLNVNNLLSIQMSHFELIFSEKRKKKIALSNEKKQPIHMRYHFFVHHEWFLQNLGKEAV